MGNESKKQIRFVTFLMVGALFCSIMVAITKLIGADEYTGMFAIAAVGFAIVTLPFSVIVNIKPRKKPVSRVDLLRKKLLEKESAKVD
jgi:hypothetical protein